MSNPSKREVLKSLQSEAVKDCAESVKADNPDLSKSQAFAICQNMENEGRLSDVTFGKDLQEDDPCESGYVMVGTKMQDGREVPNCVPEEDADPANLASDCPEGQIKVGDDCIDVEEVEDVPPSSLDMSTPRIMQGATRLDLQPIEREELENGNVAYRNIKLIDKGVWTDENSRTPTLYDTETFENTEPESNGYEGPPVNIHHDLNAQGEPNEASVGGYIDPNSLSTDGDALFGDLILNTDEAAGDFADENLQSSLESNGEVGFSPSVELTPTEMGQVEHPQAEEHVKAAKLTGLGLVRDPASKSVDFRHETRHREVAMSDGSQKVKVLSKEPKYMADIDAIRDTMEEAGIDCAEKTDEEVMDMAESLHGDLMEELEMGDYEDEEEEDEKDMQEDDEEEEDEEMQDGAIDSLEEQIDDIWGKIEELEDMMEMQASQETLEETKEELSEAKDELTQELADAETVEEIEKRLSEVENEPKDPKTLADGDSEEEDWYNSDSGVTYDSATGSTSF